MKYVIRERQRAESDYNAGSKARSDVDQVLCALGFLELPVDLELDTSKAGVLKKAQLHYSRYSAWKRCGTRLDENDVVVFQYPVRNHTIFFGSILKKLNQRGIRTIGIIHDLESLRMAIDTNVKPASRLRYSLEEVSALKYFTKIIVHNDHMKTTIHDMFHVPLEKMISLQIFDYLYQPTGHDAPTDMNGPVIIAGNLAPKKAGYVYALPQNVKFDLFGANLDDSFAFQGNVTYKGKVKPDILPTVLKGSFGLVWDGPFADTCEGVYGEYLKINNPHKTSLYLASGLPVIVWSQSAMADFVKEHGCGWTVDSLQSIGELFTNLTSEKYSVLAKNAQDIGDKIRNGFYLKKAMEQIV